MGEHKDRVEAQRRSRGEKRITTHPRRWQRQEDGAYLQSKASTRSPREQLDRLNARLGTNIGAAKERRRIEQQLKASTPKDSNNIRNPRNSRPRKRSK